MATHTSILAWRIPWSLVGYSSWGGKESDTTEWLTHTHTHTHTHILYYAECLVKCNLKIQNPCALLVKL